jgi:transketolase
MRDAFGQALLDLADKFIRMVVLDADVSVSTKTIGFGDIHPDRFFVVGVTEANMADIAGGMAASGLRPVVSAFAIFVGLKCTDQIRNVACYNNLPVVFVGGYCGLSDSFDGASHQSITDIAILRAMPNMTVIAPADAVEIAQALEWALGHDGPTYIRISRNEAPVLSESEPPLEVGKIRKIKDGSDVTIAACGAVLPLAIEAADALAGEGISAEVLEVSTIKPMDAQALAASASKTGRILTVEEHNVVGGLGGAIAESLGVRCPVKMDFVGIGDTFTESGPYADLMTRYGISTEEIVRKARLLTAD